MTRLLACHCRSSCQIQIFNLRWFCLKKQKRLQHGTRRAQPWWSWWGRHNLSKKHYDRRAEPPTTTGIHWCLWTTVSYNGPMSDSVMRNLHTPHHSGDVTWCGHKPIKTQFLLNFLKVLLQFVTQPMGWMAGEGPELLLLTRCTTSPQETQFTCNFTSSSEELLARWVQAKQEVADGSLAVYDEIR